MTMIKNRKYLQVISSFFLAGLLLLTSCSSQSPSSVIQPQKESTQLENKNTPVVENQKNSKSSSNFDEAKKESKQAKIDKTAIQNAKKGGDFNKFFPSSGSGYERVFTQEKKGFAQAKLKKDGQELAMMTISDTVTNPDAKSAFKQSTQSIKGYPSVEKGKNSTSVLVGDRFQVKVSSSNTSFTKDDRILWLEKFNLDGLAQQ